MDNLHRLLSIFLFICYIAAIVLHPARSELLSHKANQQHASYNLLLRPHDFPNEQLYRSYLAIQRFKSTITSDPKNVTATWTGNDLCGKTTYKGFYCGAPGRDNKLTVTAVILNGYNLHAPKLQGLVDELPDLALFHAASNSFGGDIPRLTGLGYMYELNAISDVPLQKDEVPDRYGTKVGGGGTATTPFCVTAGLNFTFHLGIPGGNKGGHFPFGIPGGNKGGHLPFSIPGGNKGGHFPGVTDAKALLLNHNNLSGPLPSNLGFSKLSYLALANNKLTGPIPSSISHLQDSLFEVLLLNNQLSGCLPHELGMLYNAAVIDAGMNQLTGPIPPSFSCLTSVEQLNLAGNRLYGQVPDAVCKLARLANLTLSGNYFTSVGPACAALIKDGVLDVKNNCIPGLANQRRPAECAAFQSQPKTTCPAASTTTQVTCPAAAAAENAAAPGERKVREYSSYVTYATLHD